MAGTKQTIVRGLTAREWEVLSAAVNTSMAKTDLEYHSQASVKDTIDSKLRWDPNPEIPGHQRASFTDGAEQHDLRLSSGEFQWLDAEFRRARSEGKVYPSGGARTVVTLLDKFKNKEEEEQPEPEAPAAADSSAPAAADSAEKPKAKSAARR